MTMHEAANEYAQALFSLLLEEELTGQVIGEVRTALQALEEQPLYAKILASPELSAHERETAVRQALEGAHPYLAETAALMVSRGHGADLCAMLRRTVELYREHEGIATAAVTAAVMPDAATLRTLEKKLSDITGKHVDLSVRVDPSLIGGMQVVLCGKLYEGSVRRKLDDLRRLLGSTTL